MEERKLIKSGPGSYVATIPIKWIRKNNLKKGSIIHTHIKSNNTITITPKISHIEKEKREFSINCKDLNKDEITDRMISCYLNDVSSILLINPDKEQTKTIKKFTNLLIGMEVVQETSTKIITEDLLDIKKISIKNSIRRIDMMIKSIFRDLENNFINKKGRQYFNSMDLNITGQCFFVRKILKLSLRDPNILQIIKFSIEDVIDNIKMVIELEEIGDNLKRISTIIQNENTDKKIRNRIKTLSEYYNNSIKSFYKYDRNMASNIFKKKEKITNSIKKLITKNKTEHFLNMYNEFLSIQKSCIIISRIAYDRWKK